MPAGDVPRRDVPRRLFLVGVAALGVVGGLVAAITAQAAVIERIDEAGHEWALANRTEASIAVARTLSFFGGGHVTVPALLVIGALAPRGPRPLATRIGAGAMLAGVAVLGGAVGVMLNRSVDRQRPPEADWVGTASAMSFPSGHTTTATLFAAGCAWALLSREGFARSHPRAVAVALVGLAAFAIGVGWSRVWLGVHWPTDVLGGWSYGVAWASLAAASALAIARTRMGQQAADQVDRADGQAVADQAARGGSR